jgi:hypothetical protein
VAKGIDVDSNVSGVLAQLKADGVEFVARYFGPSKSDPLTAAEAKAISDAGLWVVSLFESGFPTSLDYFTYEQGAADAHAAYAEARAAGQPFGTPIYFCVDFDAPSDSGGPVDLYWEGLRSALFRIGGSILPYQPCVYGSGLICRTLIARGFAHRGWLAQASGWAESSTFMGWSIRQLESTTLAGLDVDRDESAASGGNGWRL